MAVEITTSFSYPNKCVTLRVTDSTGDYDASTNPGGYGSPNIERTDYALYAIGKYKGIDGTDVDISLVNTLPKTVTFWDFTLAANGPGWYQATLVHIPIWDSGTSYAVNQVVFDDTDDALYIALGTTTIGAAPSLTPAEWDEIADASVTLEMIANSPSTYGPTTEVLSNQFNKVDKCTPNTKFTELVTNEAKDGCCGGCDDKKRLIDKIRLFRDAATLNEAQGKYLAAAKNVAVMEDLVTNEDCGC